MRGLINCLHSFLWFMDWHGWLYHALRSSCSQKIFSVKLSSILGGVCLNNILHLHGWMTDNCCSKSRFIYFLCFYPVVMIVCQIKTKDRKNYRQSGKECIRIISSFGVQFWCRRGVLGCCLADNSEGEIKV